MGEEDINELPCLSLMTRHQLLHRPLDVPPDLQAGTADCQRHEVAWGSWDKHTLGGQSAESHAQRFRTVTFTACAFSAPRSSETTPWSSAFLLHCMAH